MKTLNGIFSVAPNRKVKFYRGNLHIRDVRETPLNYRCFRNQWRTFRRNNNVINLFSLNDLNEIRLSWGRVLSAEEWKFLFESHFTEFVCLRTNKGLMFKGLIIFPDDICQDQAQSFLNVIEGSFIKHEITEDNLNSSKAVFLTADGFFDVHACQGEKFRGKNAYGCYWSASTDGVRGFYGLYFTPNGVQPYTLFNPKDELSVRLVKDI